MSKLIQLIYVSDLPAGQETELPAILETSVRRNGEDGLTGMLLYAGGNIMQVLEGEEGAVRRTYERISCDPRHRNIILLSEEAVPAPDFPDWRMGYKFLSPQVLHALPQFAPIFKLGFKLDAIQAAPGIAKKMLMYFASNG